MQHRRLIAASAVVGLLFVVFLTLRQRLGIEFSPDSLQGAVAGAGVWGPLLYVTLMAFRVPLGIPSQLMLLGGGLVFGPIPGTLYGAIGLGISALVLFAGARWAGRASLEARLPGRLRPLLEIAGTRAGVAFIGVGTGYPFGPVTMYHLMAGVTGMSLAGFGLAALLGSFVRSGTYSYFGSALSSGELYRVFPALGVFTLVLVVPLCFRMPRSWILQASGRRVAREESRTQSSERRL